jgi:hypothetical protein
VAGPARVTIGKARDLAGMTLRQFRQLLGSRQIGSHYDLDEYRKDMETLRELGAVVIVVSNTSERGQTHVPGLVLTARLVLPSGIH